MQWRSITLCVSLLLLSSIVFLGSSLSDNAIAAAASSSNNSNSNVAIPSPTATPIPVGQMVSEAEKTANDTREVRDFVGNLKISRTVSEGIATIPAEVDDLKRTTTELLANRATLESVTSIERDWQNLDKKTTDWTSSIQRQVAEIDLRIARLDALKEKWTSSIKALKDSSSTASKSEQNVTLPSDPDVVPDEVVRRINEIIAEIDSTKKNAGEKRAELLTLESRLSETQSIIDEQLADLKSKRESLLANIFRKDDVAVWSMPLAKVSPSSLFAEFSDTINEQSTALRVYAATYPQRFLFHGLFFIVTLIVMFQVRRKISPITEKEPKLVNQAAFFKMPVVSALIISALFAVVIYPQSPRLLITAIGTALIIPGVILLRQIIEKPLNYLLYGLLAFYITDRIREIAPDITVFSRIIFVAEMLAACVLLTWFYRSQRVASMVEAGIYNVYALIKRAIPWAVFAFFIAFLANVAGFVSLSYLIGNGLLRSAYAALIAYTIVRIVSAAVAFALRMWPCNLLASVRHNRSYIRQKIDKYISRAMTLIWFLIVLNIFSIQDVVFLGLGGLLGYQINIGEISFAIGDIVLFFVTVWVAVQLSKLIRFLLEEDVFPRIGISGGVSFSISSVVHYLILITGFLIGVAAIGIELSRFAVVIGAIGVGIGFGLQNIINNFVSGLILLFERPVKVGDTIELSGQIGKLKKIGLRASVLRKVDGSEVIVPNSQLIAEEVVNWTGSDDTRRLDIPIGVAYGTDPHRVIELLSEIPKKYDLILVDPPPRAIFKAFGENSLDFELRLWVHDDSNWVPLRSEVIMAIHDGFVEAGIEMPFPQRDLHIRSIDPDAVNEIASINRINVEK